MTDNKCSPDTMDALKDYISDWARIIWDATGDQTKVDRAILLADLNGMFDPVKVAGLTSVAQRPTEPQWTEDGLALAFFDYSACTERRCGWTEPGTCDCRNAARRTVNMIKHVLPRSFPLASSLPSTPRATPIDHSNEECPNFPGCHCVDHCCDGWKHPSPEISSPDREGK